MWALTLYRSTIGKKIIMAVTGLVLVAFVIGHMAGNLQQFLGPRRQPDQDVTIRHAGDDERRLRGEGGAGRLGIRPDILAQLGGALARTQGRIAP